MTPNPQKPKKYIWMNGHIYKLEEFAGGTFDPNGLYDFDMMFGTKTMLSDDITELMKKTPEYDNEKKDLYWEIVGLKNELQKYKDIENELGIDLPTLFKAMTQGAWMREGLLGWCYTDGKPVFVKPEDLHFSTKTYYLESRANDSSAKGEENVACIFDMEWEDIYHIAKTKDYGKTWALTKEELE